VQLMSEYLTDLCIYLETMVETARQLLPDDAFYKVQYSTVHYCTELKHLVATVRC